MPKNKGISLFNTKNLFIIYEESSIVMLIVVL